MRCWCGLGLLLCSTAAARAAPPPLDAGVPTATGDGRSLAEVTVSGGPPRARIEPAGRPVLPRVRCDGAAVYAARGEHPPAILCPAFSEARTVTCEVERRGAQVSVDLQLRPPGPGLYAEIEPTHAGTGDPPVVGTAFVIDNAGARRAVGSLQVVASAGAVSVTGDRFTVTLPNEKAPQVIAIAMVDGESVGAAFVPVHGRVELPVTTSSGTQVRVRVAGDWFGPVRAERGTVTVPLEVPPGVEAAVVRAADPLGNVGETVVDLNPPDRPRLAMAAPGLEVSAGSRMMLAVAYATPDGRPGGAGVTLRVEAERGRVGGAEYRGGGLWAVPYTALADVGGDQVVVQVEGDAAAGEARVGIRTVPGSPARVEIELPPEPLAAGSELEAPVRVLDWIGLPLADVPATVTLGGESVPVERVDDGLRARLRLPERVPTSGLPLRLEARAASAYLSRTITVGPASLASAEIEVESRGRSAIVTVVAADPFGNLVRRDRFELVTEGANMGEVHESEDGYETELVAHHSVWEGNVRVIGESGTLAESVVSFTPPTAVFRLGVVATAGMVTNGHGMYSARGGLALAIRRGFGAFDLALDVGVDVTGHATDIDIDLEGADHSVSRGLTAVGLPVRFSGRRWLSRHFGVAAGVSVVPMYVHVSVAPDFQATQVAEDWLIALRADLRGFVSLGPGEVFLNVQLSGAQLDHALVSGTVERFALVAGYAFWVPGLAF